MSERAKDVIERQNQVDAFRQVLQTARAVGLPVVVISPHTAQCVAHRIEELEERLVEMIDEKVMLDMR